MTTGFGQLATTRIPVDQVRQLQRNLVRSHAVGVGEPLPRDVVRAAMLLRASTVAKGYSGVRTEVLETLCALLNRDLVPYVPSRGSLGASGDLAPSAHLVLAMMGEGEFLSATGERAAAAPVLAGGRDRADLARSQGGPVAAQRHAVHGGDRLPYGRPTAKRCSIRPTSSGP